MTVLITGAVAVRAWLMVGYSQAFLGFPDSGLYVYSAAGPLFGHAQDPASVQKVAGYPILLRVIHFFSSDLSVTIFVQHVLGIATGVLLYKAVRRSGAPPYLGLLPAAIVFFGGTGLFLEHSLLADAPFAFVQALGVYAAVRALSEPGLRWPLLSGVAIGASFLIKPVGLASALLVPPLLLLAAPGPWRRRLLSATTAALAVLVMVFAYVADQGLVTGYWGYLRGDGWNLYARVATFVDCSRFTPPAGTSSLCPTEPVGHRGSQNYFEYGATSPAVHYVTGDTAQWNATLQRFSVAAIEDEPIAYLKAILHGLPFYISPRGGEGYTPAELTEELLKPTTWARTIGAYYPGFHAYTSQSGSIRPLVRYGGHTRVQGAFLVLLLLAAIAGAPLLRGRTRWSAILFTLTAIFSAILAVAGNSYDARYAYPAFGPLAAGAALGAWAIATRLKQERVRRWPAGRAGADVAR
jgi:Dolichyl-phosphate-mannose-protein mannosyltransferase